MSQLRFDWEVPPKPSALPQPTLELDPETTKAVLALMARVLLAVASAAKEPDDDR